MDSRTFIHLYDAKCLKSAIAPKYLAHDTGSLIGRLIAVPPQNGDVNQNVRKPSIWNDEPKAFGNIKPLYVAGYYEDVYARLLCDVVKRCNCGR
jgi:hypothetical protein